MLSAASFRAEGTSPSRWNGCGRRSASYTCWSLDNPSGIVLHVPRACVRGASRSSNARMLSRCPEERSGKLPRAEGAPRLGKDAESNDRDRRDRLLRRNCCLGERPGHPPFAGGAPRLDSARRKRSAGALHETLRARRRPNESARSEERACERPPAEGALRLDECIDCHDCGCRDLPRRRL